MTDIAKIREEKYTQLKKKIDKQSFRAKHLLRVMRYQHKRYFGTELPDGDHLVNVCRGVVLQAKKISSHNDWWYKNKSEFQSVQQIVNDLETQIKDLTEYRQLVQEEAQQRIDKWEKTAFIDGDEIRIDNIIKRLIAQDDNDLPLPDDHDTAKQVLEQAVRCMGALLSLGHIERKKIVQCKFEKLLVQFHRKFFYNTEKEVAVQLIEGINKGS